jgi:AmiR/NasT family two-component response regulator
MAPDVESALDAGIVTKPVGHHGVFTSLFFAFNEHQRRRHFRDELSTARGRLGARRIVVKAIIHLMGTYGFDDDEAYQHLRRKVCASVYVSNSFPQGLSPADKAAIGLRTPRRD